MSKVLIHELSEKIWDVSEHHDKPQDIYKYLDLLRDAITIMTTILFGITEHTYFQEE